MRWEEDWVFENLGWPFSPRRSRQQRRSGRRGRNWKWFRKGDLKFAILALVAEKPMHGYEVMQALEEESHGCYKASPGSIYPTLQLLEDQGLLRSNSSDGKKVYHITEEGQAFLNDHQEQVDDIFARAERFGDRVFGNSMADLSRSFAKFSQTTFQGAVGWLDDEELLSDMKEVLNRAAKEMEEAWESASTRRRDRRRGRPGARAEGEAGQGEEPVADASEPEASDPSQDDQA